MISDLRFPALLLTEKSILRFMLCKPPGHDGIGLSVEEGRFGDEEQGLDENLFDESRFFM